jgi:hypothetical protein
MNCDALAVSSGSFAENPLGERLFRAEDVQIWATVRHRGTAMSVSMTTTKTEVDVTPPVVTTNMHVHVHLVVASKGLKNLEWLQLE